MIDLYTWTTPNGRKISIALEEMGLPYTVHPVNLQKGEQHSPEFAKISPNEKIPAIVDRDEGITLMESGAILIYLAEKSGKFLPTETRARFEVLQWLMWQMGGFGPMLGQAHQFLKYNPGVSEFAEKRYGDEAKRLYGVLDRRLAESPYVGGSELSIADFATWPWASRFEYQRIDLTAYSNVCRWYHELADRPAFRRGYDVPHFVHEIPRPGCTLASAPTANSAG
ncbi:glutathione S-transferase family protein [Ostreiculturibacter nitratireducens]|uniref:glutathione S-transferase family protein n=1 Tax=Ostreiculturibacter nitratireducens TaxID=3075226 RepID=UPI0031B602B7